MDPAGADGGERRRPERTLGAAPPRSPRRRRARGRGRATRAAGGRRQPRRRRRPAQGRRGGGVVTRVSPLRRLVGSRWFKLALSAALLAFLLVKTDVRDIRTALAAARPAWLMLSLAALVASQVVSAYRWALLAWAIGFTEPFTRVCTYYFSGMYLNLFGPGTVAGDLGRVLFLAGGQRRALALTTVVAHRAIGFVALVWIGATAVV